MSLPLILPRIQGMAFGNNERRRRIRKRSVKKW